MDKVPLMDRVVTKYKLSINTGEDIYKYPRRKPQTAEIKKLAKTRRGYVKLVFHAVKDHFRYDGNESVVAAAGVVMPVLEKFAGLDKREYAQATTDVKAFTNMLLVHGTELDLLGIRSAVNDLIRVNNEFSSVYTDRVEYKSAGKQKGSITGHRAGTDRAFAAVCKVICALDEVVETEAELEALKRMANGINGLISQFKAIYHHHTGMMKRKEGKEVEVGG